jgi:hypothetical protein
MHASFDWRFIGQTKDTFGLATAQLAIRELRKSRLLTYVAEGG